eukprot:CAMPEP_0184548632 /NCGR_PEP_ID=MMETSP0199_2-20130426/6316_1 /TAXON_ID=1112570 /ORGANISM="Thraustochytrium sp., Strain LLF1b" /LENGTH=229 /DNA_ID=CAMNT_0026943257 /DNA_START=172 /DNA_END=858 /DNA_ORIENTATION=-
MIILSLEGCHGSGKTTLLEQFKTFGFQVLDEGYLDMPTGGMHPQSLVMETTWVCSWFARVLRLAQQLKEQKKSERTVLVTDRSPYSAVVYCNNEGYLLEPLIRQQMQEVKRHAGVDFYAVHVKVEKEVLWSRILKRLEREPDREILKEMKRSWTDEIVELYEGLEWDFEVDNTPNCDNASMKKVMNNIIAQARAVLPGFAGTVADMESRHDLGSESECDETKMCSPPLR